MACYCKGLFEEAENSLSQALPLCKKTALLGWETWGTGFLGHAYVAMGNYKKALEADKSNGTMWSLGCDYAFYAELHKHKGHPEKARENLNRAIEIFSECGAEGWQNKAEGEMAALV